MLRMRLEKNGVKVTEDTVYLVSVKELEDAKVYLSNLIIARYLYKDNMEAKVPSENDNLVNALNKARLVL